MKLSDIKPNPSNPRIIKDVKIILATSYFEFFYIEFMQRFGLKYDLIINNRDSAAFWINDL